MLEEEEEQSRPDYVKRLPDILEKLRDKPENMDFEIKQERVGKATVRAKWLCLDL
jgi:hypothetical protein